VERINEAFCREEKPKVNSLLINRYEEKSGYLPEHSDNEPSIHPESEIFTLSIGGECEVLYTGCMDDSKSEKHKCTPRSLYRMTRRSQDYFLHSIAEGSVTGGTRYSLTFRSVNHKNKGSTCIFGDSNAARLRFGQDHKKSFGAWLPGHNHWAPTIDDIDPYLSVGYKNIVIMSGINDVRQNHVKCQRDIHDIFMLLRHKISVIQCINPHAHVFICPLLPSKNAELNRKSLYFNKLLYTELLPTNFGVTCVDGFDGFCDQAGLLSRHLSRDFDKYGRSDYLHLNWKGVAKLGVMIRDTVLLRVNGGIDKRKKYSSPVDSRTYEQVVRGGGSAAFSVPTEDGYQS
jgi:hypothetical protein